MPKIKFIICCYFGFLVCSSAKAQFPLSSYKAYPHNPKVKVLISFSPDTFSKNDSIKVSVTIINEGHTTQKVLFGKRSGGIAWGLTGNVTDKAGKSVTVLQNKSVLYSHFYFESELEKKGYYYYLKPGDSTETTYSLNQILVLHYKGEELPPGKYFLELSYFSNSSNKAEFVIRN